MIASEHCDSALVASLVENGADVNITDKVHSIKSNTFS